MPDAAKQSLEEAFDHFEGLSEVPGDVVSALRSLGQDRQVLKGFRPRVLARATLAAASVSPPDDKVLAAACERIPEADLTQFEPTDLTMFCWALAAANHRDVAAMSAVGHQVAERAWEFCTEDLAKMVFAYAELRLLHQAMMATVAMEVMWKIDQFSAHSLAQTAVSCARLGYCKEPMFDWVAARVIGRLDDYSPEDLSHVCWSFGEASIKNDVLANAVAGEVAKKDREFDDEELARMVWAFGKLNVAPRSVMQPLYHQRLSDT